MKITLFTLIGLSLLLLGRAWAETPVHIPDPGLKAAIEETLWVSDPTPTDMLGLTHLEAQARNISDLTGLGYAENLQSLSLRFNHVSDLYPLGGLANLSSLSLNDNEVSDVSPLGGLANLRSLDLHDNKISDVSALAGMVNLTSLALRQNPISDISPLSSMPNLADLSLMETRVSDISPLSSLTSLRYVDLRDCPLNNDAYDVYMPQIRANNPGIDIDLDPYRGRMLTLSSTFGGSVVEPGEGEFLYPFDTLVHLKAEADPGFVFVGWTGPFPIANNTADIYTERNYEFRAHFMSLRDTLYVDDDAPADPAPGDPAVSDPNADGTSEHPIESIQDTIDVAGQETTIMVSPGHVSREYQPVRQEDHLDGRRSAHPHAGPCAIIEGTSDRPVVTDRLRRGSKCSLSGFVITKGRGDVAGGIYCSGASPRLSNCLIVGNRCSDPNGAAVYFHDSQTVMTNCTIADNYGGEDGAGMILDDSNVVVVDSIFWGNRPYEIRSRGTSEPSIRYCCVRDWWPDIGNIHSDPLFARPGYWTDPKDPNVVLESDNPRAAWADGDYHVKSQAGRWDPAPGSWVRDDVTSPCIDAGDPAGAVGHEFAPNGGIVNLGAYGGTTEASRSR